MAVVSLIALLVALALAILISARSWLATEVAPQLSVAPGLGVALDDSVALARPGGPGGPVLGSARPASAGGPALAVSSAVANEGDSAPRSGLAPARIVAVVSHPAPLDAAPAPSAPEAVAEPAPAAPEPSAVPVAATPPAPAQPPASAPSPGSAPFRLGSQPAPPSVAGIGEEEEAPAEEEPSAEEEEAEAEGEGEESEGEEAAGEDECAPPFPFFSAGAWHEVVLCIDASEQGDFYLLLDGEPIEASLPGAF